MRRAYAGFAAVDAVIETSPAGLSQPEDRVVGRAVADEPYPVTVRSEGLHETFKLILEVEH
jgi:hypothetical protein